MVAVVVDLMQERDCVSAGLEASSEAVAMASAAIKTEARMASTRRRIDDETARDRISDAAEKHENLISLASVTQHSHQDT